MYQKPKMVLKPQEQLVTRLFLSPRLKQNLKVLSYSRRDLVNAVKDLCISNPFVSLRGAKDEMQNLDWIRSPVKENLIDHLLWQVNLNNWKSKDKQAVKLLIYNLDQDGYLRISLSEIARMNEFSLPELEKARTLLQTLDPLGIGATNLSECLLIQALEINAFNPIALQILRNNQLQLLASPEKWSCSAFSRIELTNALTSIQSLNPIPASEYVNNDNSQYLVPDLIYKVEDGRLTIESAQSQLPELLFDEKAFIIMQSQSGEKEYFSAQKRQYLEMKHAIEERQRTIIRLGQYVGQYQHKFLLTLHKQDLKPLSLREVSQALGLAQSTISRAIKDKYLQCQNQIFSLKLLFPRSVTENISQEQIEYNLTKIFKNENPQNPLSDQQIADLFNKQDVHLSRRVISKYRQKLGIPNSYNRKS